MTQQPNQQTNQPPVTSVVPEATQDSVDPEIQRARDTGQCYYCGSTQEVGTLYTPWGNVPCCFECMW